MKFEFYARLVCCQLVPKFLQVLMFLQNTKAEKDVEFRLDVKLLSQVNILQ